MRQNGKIRTKWPSSGLVQREAGADREHVGAERHRGMERRQSQQESRALCMAAPREAGAGDEKAVQGEKVRKGKPAASEAVGRASGGIKWLYSNPRSIRLYGHSRE